MAGANCVICCELYSKPKVLPCGHSCCVECLRGWANRANDKPSEEDFPQVKDLSLDEPETPTIEKKESKQSKTSSTLTPKPSRKGSKSPTPTAKTTTQTSRLSSRTSVSQTPKSTTSRTAKTSSTGKSTTPSSSRTTPKQTGSASGQLRSSTGQSRRLNTPVDKVTSPASRAISGTSGRRSTIGSPQPGIRKRPESARSASKTETGRSSLRPQSAKSSVQRSESPALSSRGESPLPESRPESPQVEVELVPPKSLTCPECRHEFDLPENGVDGLPNNVALSRATEVEVPFCGDCKSRPQALKCLECVEWLCSECGELHQQISSTSGHTLMTAEQLKEGLQELELKSVATEPTPFIEEALPPKPKSKFLPCPKHPDEPQKYFCIDCDEAVCNDCLNVDHVVHQRMMLEDKARDVMAMYECRSIYNEDKIRSIKDRMRDINKADTNQRKNTEQTLMSLQQRTDEICGLVERRASELKSHLEMHLHSQLNSNQLYRNKLTLDIDKLQAEGVLASMQAAMPHEVINLSKKLEEEAAKEEASYLREEPDPRWIKWTFQPKPVTLIENTGTGKEVKPLTDEEVIHMMFGDLGRTTMAVRKGEVQKVNACNPQ